MGAGSCGQGCCCCSCLQYYTDCVSHGLSCEQPQCGLTLTVLHAAAIVRVSLCMMIPSVVLVRRSCEQAEKHAELAMMTRPISMPSGVTAASRRRHLTVYDPNTQKTALSAICSLQMSNSSSHRNNNTMSISILCCCTHKLVT